MHICKYIFEQSNHPQKHGRMIQCIEVRGKRARTGVFDGLTLHTNIRVIEVPKVFGIVEIRSKTCQSYLIGSEPKITPLQLRAAIALSACKNEAKKNLQTAKTEKRHSKTNSSQKILGNNC